MMESIGNAPISWVKTFIFTPAGNIFHPDIVLLCLKCHIPFALKPSLRNLCSCSFNSIAEQCIQNNKPSNGLHLSYHKKLFIIYDIKDGKP